MATPIRTAKDYTEQIRRLLPYGPAWDKESVPDLELIIKAIAEEFARIDARSRDLLNEMEPSTLWELVPDWERVMDLPDPCLGNTPLFEDRRLAVFLRMIAVGGQSPAYFLNLAKQQGYPNAYITEFRAPRFGNARFGKAHFGSWAAQFMWVLHTGEKRRTKRRFGSAVFGNRFGESPGSALECVIKRYAPAHTLVTFDYGD